MKDAGVDVLGKDDALYQDGVDGDTDHHEETLKTQGSQVAQVVIAHLPPFPVSQSGKGDWSNRTG